MQNVTSCERALAATARSRSRAASLGPQWGRSSCSCPAARAGVSLCQGRLHTNRLASHCARVCHNLATRLKCQQKRSKSTLPWLHCCLFSARYRDHRPLSWCEGPKEPVKFQVGRRWWKNSSGKTGCASCPQEWVGRRLWQSFSGCRWREEG